MDWRAHLKCLLAKAETVWGKKVPICLIAATKKKIRRGKTDKPTDETIMRQGSKPFKST